MSILSLYLFYARLEMGGGPIGFRTDMACIMRIRLLNWRSLTRFSWRISKDPFDLSISASQRAKWRSCSADILHFIERLCYSVMVICCPSQSTKSETSNEPG